MFCLAHWVHLTQEPLSCKEDFYKMPKPVGKQKWNLERQSCGSEVYKRWVDWSSIGEAAFSPGKTTEVWIPTDTLALRLSPREALLESEHLPPKPESMC